MSRKRWNALAVRAALGLTAALIWTAIILTGCIWAGLALAAAHPEGHWGAVFGVVGFFLLCGGWIAATFVAVES